MIKFHRISRTGEAVEGLSSYTIQEAIESPAFPNIKLITLKMFKILNIVRTPRIVQNRSRLHFLVLGRTPFTILIAIQKEILTSI